MYNVYILIDQAERRSIRDKQQPLRYEEEQAANVLQALELMDLSRALDASIQENEPILSPDSSVPPIQYEEKDEEDIKEEMNDNWSIEDNDVPAPRFHSFIGLTNSSSIAQSPLEFLQLFRLN